MHTGCAKYYYRAAAVGHALIYKGPEGLYNGQMFENEGWFWAHLI